jgi:SAM-dependent methyltransferase
MKPSNSTWPQYIRRGVGRRLSLLGEKLNIHWLIYNPIHFMHFHELALENAPGVIRTFTSIFPNASRYVDVGAGTGAFAAEAQRAGRQVLACEHSPKGRKVAARQGVDCRAFDLMKEPPAQLEGRFDLAYCFEVAEHLPPQLGQRLVRYLAELAPLVIFTAAQPGQGGTGHINEQPKNYWVEQFQKAGMRHDADLSQRVATGFKTQDVKAPWLIDNVLVFVK